MNDLEIPLKPREKRSSAAYMDQYIRGLREHPNVLFRVAAGAGRAADYLLERFEKIMKLEKKEDLLPEPQVRHRKCIRRKKVGFYSFARRKSMIEECFCVPGK